jgi:hypothetical protein
VSDAARHLAGDGFKRPELDPADSACAPVPPIDGTRSQTASDVATQA